MNKNKLTALCHRISKESGLTFNSVMTQYFLETVLHRLANSKYKGNLIFKGGFLLSNVLGLQTRSTVDIDFLLTKIQFSEEKIRNIFSEVLTTDSENEIEFELQEIQEIIKGEQYGGYRVMIACSLQNIKQYVPLDIATGDVVTPNPIDYRYKSSFGREDIMIRAYTIETIVAEKIHTIFNKGFLNSRSKDYYDLYIINHLRKNLIDKDILLQACQNTFRYRDKEFNLEKIKRFLQEIRNDENFAKRWQGYEKKNPYAQGISFTKAVDSASMLLELMEE